MYINLRLVAAVIVLIGIPAACIVYFGFFATCLGYVALATPIATWFEYDKRVRAPAIRKAEAARKAADLAASRKACGFR